MKTMIRFANILPLLLLTTLTTRAQQDMPIILKAMHDEQQRSMKELRLEGHDTPFYISYEVNDIKSYFFSANSGALVQSGSRTIRSKNTRVLVGGYEFNDESLDNNIYTNPQPNEIDMPLDDDYYGIRRSLWVTTDAIYRSAARHFKENQNTLKEKGKELKDLPHRTFAKVEPQQINTYKVFKEPDIKTYENYVRKASEFFRGIPEIYSSRVSLTIVQGNRYYLNTEGTSSISPISSVELEISAAKDHLWRSNQQLSRFYSSLDKLPSVEQLAGLLKNFSETVIRENTDTKIDDYYAGPVLLLGEATAQALHTMLFGRESLVAGNNLEVDDRYRMENSSSLENRIGKIVASDEMTVTAKPKLKTYAGVELMGSFEVDDEGVTPPDELVLIEKGILKTLLNDRSLTKPDQTANGHAHGPGVIEITFSGNNTQESLKKYLLENAKNEGYDYAFVIKELGGRNQGNGEVYRIDVATGREELLADVFPNSLQLKHLRKARATSGKLVPHNLDRGGGGNQVSIICPDAILLEGVEMMQSRMKEPGEDEPFYVEPPK